MSSSSIQILHLEDSSLDAELIRERLEKSSVAAGVDWVVDRDSFIARLKSRCYDVILSDYQVPTLEAMESLDLAMHYQPETPFIYISGAMGEEFAVETLKRGATDYVLKERLVRLTSAIERAVKEKQERTERIAAEAASRETEAKFRALANAMPNLAWMARPDGHIFWYNHRWYEYTGTTPDQMDGWGWQQVHDQRVLPEVLTKWRQSIANGAAFEMVFPLLGCDGVFRPFLTRAETQTGNDGEILHWFGTCTDISLQKQAEEQLVVMATQQRARADFLARLAKVSRELNAVLSMDRMMLILANQARRIVGANLVVASILKDDLTGERLQAIAASEKFPQLGPTSIKTVANTESFHEGSEWRQLVDDSKSLIIALSGHGETNVGQLQIFEKTSGGEFTSEDEAVLIQLATIATASFENARLYETLRLQDQRKDEFLATLAHELRNPLAPLRNGLQVLRLAGDDVAASTEAREMMDRQLSHMVRIIDDLLDVSRITRGKMELRRSCVSLTDIVNNALEIAKPMIDAAGHELTVLLPHEPIFLFADLTRLAQVFGNLLTNSAKYTERGGRIWLAVVVEDDQVVVTVKDTGIGMSAEALPSVFDMFSQVDQSIERSACGLGIGLALVKGLVEAHSGTVRADSPGEGRGSTFIIRLPAIPVRDQISGAEFSDEKHGPLSRQRRRILVVDDNRDSAKTMAMMLKLLNHEVRVAYDGIDAVETAEPFRPQIILMDVGMPRLNGYGATRRIREQPWGRSTIIIALTGWGQEDDKERSREAGCDGHLVKPVNLADLDRLLAELTISEPSADGTPQPMNTD